MGIPSVWLEGSPFGDYLIPGVILLLPLGVVPLIVAHGLLRRRPWSWYGALLIGVMLVVWIIVEVLVIGYQTDPPLQLVYGLVGVAILALVSLSSVRCELTGARRKPNS